MTYPQHTYPPVPPAPPGPSKAKRILKVAWLVAGGILVFGIGAAAGSSGSDPGTEAAPAATVTVTAQPDPAVTVTATPKAAASPKPTKTAKPKPAGPPTSFGPGSYLVGTDIAAGTYRTQGPADSDFPYCYWERTKDASGEFDAIIANGTPEGPTSVTVGKGEYIDSSGCQEWKKVG